MEMLTGIIRQEDFTHKSKFSYAFDRENHILHLRDKDDHDGASLINTIDSNFRDKVTKIVEQEYGISVNSEKVRCFIYTDGDGDFFGHEVDEYVFVYESENKNPFESVKKEDKPLLYWYRG
ncbi:hypothetical protein JOC86_002206 [Bacillus pakistanensis]|uniref:Uncharacterized protein n=1 Tax=Rossellomorea pakistanensis TaxID=992288 RepID=A0ABS2ND40_9BACI|nr:hypothetical protein [Bacillus pakistanensis]MBM7585664.1 hypothetical protein [Bacillus pakistanensis]